MDDENRRDFSLELDSSHSGFTFDDEDSTFKWALDLSNEFKFNIIRSSRAKRRNMVGQFHHYFACDSAKRSEKPETKAKNEQKKKVGMVGKSVDKLKKRLTSSKRIGCEFRGVIRKEDDGRFHVTVFEGHHNHPLTYYREGKANLTRLTERDKLKVMEMYRAHCKPKAIVDALQYSEDVKPYLLRPVYNEIAKMNREDAEGRNPASEFFHLARERDYLTRFTLVPKTDQVKDLFWSHPNGRKLVRCYPTIFCIDATYGTNRYNYALIEIIGVAPTNQNFTAAQALVKKEDKESYMWVMECFKELFVDGNYPKALITDRELGLFEPIAVVFPDSKHVLCMQHVRKMILARAIIVMDTSKDAEVMCRGAVKRMLKAPTLEEFYENEMLLREKYDWVPGFMKYMDETWLCHKEKICFAWTNQIRHFGNNTTNRVESAHSSLKDWMISSRVGVDTLFDQVHAECEGQAKGIRLKLEHSRSRNLDGFDVSPFMPLLRIVSHHCLMLLKKEYTKLGRCTHAMVETHGTPCRCLMEIMYHNRQFIPVEDIDPFWTTLVYDGEDCEQFVVPKGPHDMLRLLEDLKKRDPADQIRASRMLYEEMYPEHCAFQQPEVNLTKKGRPSKKKTKSTRELSGWEHVDIKYGSGPSSQASNNSKVNELANKLMQQGSADVPAFVREHLVAIDDVEGDGNCGFRVAALKFMNDEHSYVTVRMMVLAEVRAYEAVYKKVYEGKKNDGQYERALGRINWTGKRCPTTYWMEVPYDLIALAQVFRAVVSLYTVDPEDNVGCCTTFPWRGAIKSFEKLKEISIIFRLSRVHYVLGHFSPIGIDPDQPLPSVHPEWREIRHPSLQVWEDVVYADRLRRFDRLQAIYRGYINGQVSESESEE